MRFRLLLVAIVLMVGGAAGLYWRFQQNNTLEATGNDTITSEMKIRQVNIGDKTFLTELAETNEEQATGLSNRISLPENQGMLFFFSPAQNISFWMKDMKFNLDIIWIKDGRVVQVDKNVAKPTENTSASDLETYSTTDPIDYVLEINAGEASEIQVGNTVTISEL